MDIQETISRVRKEYKDYLREKHPDWAENSLSTHVSDAFYLYQNTIALSFWKCFESDESMAAAKQDILEYLKHDVMSERAEERTAGYFNDLKMLKEFLDTKGGVRAYVGPEYDCEVTVYKYAKMAYDGALSSDDAVAAMCKEVPFFGETSHKLMVMLFASMMEGTRYTRRGNTETTIYFIVHIGQDYGKDRMVNALKATHQNITYYYEQTGNKSNSIRRGCTKVAKDNNIDMDFSEKMFEGIIPKESSDTALTVDDTAVRYWLYAAGDGSVNWENDYAEGIMAIGWDNMGDLMQYSSKEEMRAKMREVYGGTSSYMKEKNLAVELLKKLIAEQVSVYRRTNIVKSEKFSELIQGAMNRYLNGMLTNEEVIQELLKLAKEIADANAEGEKLGLNADELAFYDALTKPQAIKDFYEHDELIAITKELTDLLRKNRTIDWQKKESARAGMRRLVKRLLKKHKYPPEGMDDAVQTVMSQCEMWTDNVMTV